MAATPALSQGIVPPRPPGGLFGSSRSDTAGGDRLTFTFDGNEGVDSQLPLQLRTLVSPADLQSGGGFSTMFKAFVDYARNRPRVRLAGSALSAVRYFQQPGQADAVSHSAALGASVRLPMQSTLQINQAAAYSPSYFYDLFPAAAVPVVGEAIPANPAYRIDATRSYSYRTNVALVSGSVRTIRLTTSAEYSHTDFEEQTAARPDPTTYTIGAKVSRAVTRNGVLSAGYEYRTGDYEFGVPTVEHRFPFGVEYSRALSVRRRATFRFNVTPATLEVPESALPNLFGTDQPLSAGAERMYRLEGDASVEYEFRPDWRASGNYRRGVDYLPLLTAPVFTDGARARVTGLITPRVELWVGAGYVTGASLFDRGTQNLETYTGEVRVTYALKRSFALYSEYLYYYYDLRGQPGLAPGLPSVFEQNGIRVGFMLFVKTTGR
jgi:hypothetical protein